MRVMMMSAAMLAAANVLAWEPTSEYFPDECANPSVKYIQRTMRKLSESTAENPATVRICFYGQSIVAQNWTRHVVSNLTSRFPTAKIIVDKPAIGGYVSPNLSRTVEPDVYPLYPDLIFFHVYGRLDKFEEIVTGIKQRTTAEVILWSSHLNRSDSADPAAKLVKRDKRTLGIRAIARRHHCMFIDLNRKWSEYMVANGMKGTELLADSVHLKQSSLPLYASVLAGELIRVPEVIDPPVSGGFIKTVSGEEKNGRLVVSFTGNRLLAVSAGTGKAGASARVLLDGEPMANKPELWAATRPSSAPRWMPCINCVFFEKPPVAETWSLTFPDGVNTNRNDRARFTLSGSVTGPDGEGWTTEDFLSKSGRIRILAQDQAAANWQCEMFRAQIKPGFVATWKTYPLFTETYTPQASGVETRLVQNCSNADHVIEIIPNAGYTVADLGIKSFTAFAPPEK